MQSPIKPGVTIIQYGMMTSVGTLDQHDRYLDE